MKKLFSTIFLGLVLSSSLFAQVSKSEVEKMMADAGASSATIVKLYVGNTITFYTDGTNKRSYAIYENPGPSSSENKVVLTETGLKLVNSKDGKIISSSLFPYNNISNIYISATNINIYLRD